MFDRLCVLIPLSAKKRPLPPHSLERGSSLGTGPTARVSLSHSPECDSPERILQNVTVYRTAERANYSPECDPRLTAKRHTTLDHRFFGPRKEIAFSRILSVTVDGTRTRHQQQNRFHFDELRVTKDDVSRVSGLK